MNFRERAIAKGYLITFRCYGTWLHGDDRGSVDRRFHNRYGGPKVTPDPSKVRTKAKLMKDEVFVLGPRERRIVESAIKEVCSVRGYALSALNVRTNHAHVVVGNSAKPERMVDSFKAYSTKALRSAGLAANDAKVWSRHGGTLYLWTEDHVSMAVDYVL